MRSPGLEPRPTAGRKLCYLYTISAHLLFESLFVKVNNKRLDISRNLILSSLVGSSLLKCVPSLLFSLFLRILIL